MVCFQYFIVVHGSNYMKLLSLVIVFCSINVNGQNRESSIKIHIADTALVADVIDKKISIHFECKNLTDSTLILYGINGSFRIFPTKIENLWQYETKMSAGRALYIYNSSLKKIGTRAPMISPDIDHKPLPESKFDSLIAAGRSKYLKGKKVIKAYETIRLTQEIDIKEYELAKGTYYIQIVYFSGPMTSAMVAPEQIEKDKNESNGTVFHGIAISNRVAPELAQVFPR